MEDFINRIYSKLNPIIIDWVDYHASLGEIDGYESNRYKTDMGINSPVNTYKVTIYLVNDYRIIIDTCAPSNVDYHVLTVRVFSPAVERVKQDDGSVDVYPAKHLNEYLRFVEGEFDIDKVGGWLTEILILLNDFVMRPMAEVEVIV